MSIVHDRLSRKARQPEEQAQRRAAPHPDTAQPAAAPATRSPAPAGSRQNKAALLRDGIVRLQNEARNLRQRLAQAESEMARLRLENEKLREQAGGRGAAPNRRIAQPEDHAR